MVAWDVTEREDPAIPADLVSWDSLLKQNSKSRQKQLSLYADNGNSMHAATLENRLKVLDVLRTFSRPRVSDDNSYSESQFPKAKYRPHYPRRPFASVKKGCLWVAALVGWHDNWHRQTSIKFVTSQQQQHSGQAVET